MGGHQGNCDFKQYDFATDYSQGVYTLFFESKEQFGEWKSFLEYAAMNFNVFDYYELQTVDENLVTMRKNLLNS